MNRWRRRGSRSLSILNEFRRLRRRRNTIKKTHPRQMNSEEITTALRTLRGYREGKWQRINLDNKYWTCTKSEFQKVVDTNTIDEKKYIVDQFDCDNFAFNFKAQVALQFNLNNVGMVIDHSGGHAYSVVIFSDGTAELFEPQNDRWVSPGESKSYSFKRGIVII